MKLNGIRIEQFQKIRMVEVAPRYPITLFAGDNDVGKTSIQDALRLAFTGRSLRVPVKKDQHQLVRRGAKVGSCVVEFTHDGKGGRAAVTLPPTKHECDPETPAALPYVLDATRFASLSENERRKLLFELMGVRVGLDSVKERLLKRGARPDLIEAVVPFLRSGFEAAEKWSTEKQSEWRGRWCQITAEDYGSVKAEKWTAQRSFSEERQAQLTALDETIVRLEEERRILTERIIGGERFLANKQTYDEQAGALQAKAAAVPEAKRLLETTRRTLEARRPELEQARRKLDEARIESQPCPSCGTLLAIRKNKFVEAKRPSKADHTALEASVSETESELRVLELTLQEAEVMVNEGLAAAQALAALETAVGTPANAEDVAADRANRDELDGELSGLRQKRDAMNTERAAAERAKQATEDARVAHELVKAWQVIREAFAPDGIPGEILTEAIGPINKRLKEAAKFTNWAPVDLQGDMAIRIDTMPYGLCGESARWRADAMIAEALSHLAGLNLLVLDRIDVLSPAHRSELLDWCDRLVEGGYETIMLFATLKGRPQLEGANVYWLHDGVVAP